MEHDDAEVAGDEGPDSGSTVGRRRLIGLGAAAGAAAWVAPAVLSSDAAAAASGTPPPPCVDCGPQAQPIIAIVVLVPCVPTPATVTATGTQSGAQSQNLSQTGFGFAGTAVFQNFCDGETVTISLTGAACSPIGSTTFIASCNAPTNNFQYSCNGCV